MPPPPFLIKTHPHHLISDLQWSETVLRNLQLLSSSLSIIVLPSAIETWGPEEHEILESALGRGGCGIIAGRMWQDCWQVSSGGEQIIHRVFGKHAHARGSRDGRGSRVGVPSTSADRIKWPNLFWFCFHGHLHKLRKGLFFPLLGDKKSLNKAGLQELPSRKRDGGEWGAVCQWWVRLWSLWSTNNLRRILYRDPFLFPISWPAWNEYLI